MPFHDRDPIGHDITEAIDMTFAFGRLAMERRNLLRVFARAHEIESEIGFETLLLEVERN